MRVIKNYYNDKYKKYIDNTQWGKKMKTIKEIANGLGLDKQKVYRYIRKNNIKGIASSDVHRKSKVKYYDDVVISIIKQGLYKKDTHHDIRQKSLQTTSD